MLFVLSALAGCGSPRSAAATQTTPAAFDPAASDANAVAVVDEMTSALGGADKWAQVKQIRWEVKAYENNELLAWARHSWDIWNGRHRHEFADGNGIAAYKASGDKDLPVFTVAMYDLFDREGKGFVISSDQENVPGARGAVAADRDRFVAEAYQAWQRDSYQLAMLFKLKDPGVKLEYIGERQAIGERCQAGCIDIKVSFAPTVGTDLYHVYLNKQTKLPEVIEKVLENNRSVILSIEDWVEAGGLKFPARLKNIALPQEYRIENVQIGEPEDDLYIPRVYG